MHKFKELKVWQKARKLVKEIYETTQKFPKEELFGLTSQMRRSAVSILANIAEGCGRDTQNELNRFMDIANGSSFELETLVIISFDLKFISQNEFDNFNDKLNEIQKMIYGFKRSIQKSS